MFNVTDVTKVYAKRGDKVTAFQVPSLQIAAGEYVAIVGPSGSGKSTLLSLLGGMLAPTTGEVHLQGASLYKQPVARRTRLRREMIGFVFQTFNLVPYLTALENVKIPFYLAGMPMRKQQEKAAELLQRLGLGDRLDHKPSELSTGQQQRVALARTLANDPPIILADEPTGNLDPDSRRQVLTFLDELHGNRRTVIMVTHDMSAAERAERRLTLDKGRVVAELLSGEPLAWAA